MKICVLGAGVIGVSTAYALARQGHEVVVLDKNADVAMGASQANGAQLSYSYVDPFAGPATLTQLPAYLLGLDPAVKLGLSLKPDYLRWGFSFLRNCTSAQTRRNLEKRAELSALSSRTFAAFSKSIPGNKLSPSGRGKLVLLPTPVAFDAAKAAADSYKALGLERCVLSTDETLEVEPALKSMSTSFAGSIYAASDWALDPVQYCQALKTAAEDLGAVFLTSQNIEKVITDNNNRVTGVDTQHGLISCDAAVVCLGPEANHILKPLGLSAPIYPMQGYSLTLPVNANSPHVSLTCLKDKIVFANLGDRIRIAGFMDTNLSAKTASKRGELLRTKARALWPNIADYDSPERSHWTGFRPMTPSGVPVIRESAISNLYLNVGHGSLGYTFAAGSAKLIADLIGSA